MLAAVDADSIPTELKVCAQWVLWRYEEREAKQTKVPYQVSGQRASSTDPRTWTTFDKAVVVYRNGGFDGIGFVVTHDADFVGVDLDHCVDPITGQIQPQAQDIVHRLESYTEVTPSGEGLRIFLRGNLPLGRRKQGNIEMYDTGRFLTVTGHHLADTSTSINHRQAELEAVHGEVFAGRFNGPLARRSGLRSEDLDDLGVVEKAKNATNGDRFSRLWEGDISGYASQSEADLALCSYLVFWCGGDPVRIDRLFRQSSLFREKWDERHGSQTYGEMTIAKVIDGTGSYGEVGYIDSGIPPRSDGINGTGPEISTDSHHLTDLV